MAWAAAIPIIMQMMQSQQSGGGQGQPSNQPMMPNFADFNHFNPQGGSGSYSSQKGMLGASGGGGGAGWMSMLGSMGTPGERAGGIANGLWNLFGNPRDPSADASKYLDQINGSVDGYMNPYIDAGKSALPQVQGQFDRLINDPTSVMSSIGGKFQQSPGYQWDVDQATRAANNAGAASGMAGSPAEQQQLATTVHGLANQDYDKFMDRGLGLYGQGLGGMSDINHMGFDASNNAMMAKFQAYLAQAQNAYAGGANRNSQVGGAIGSLMGGLF